MKTEHEQFLEQLEETHHVDVRNGDALVWVFGEPLTAEHRRKITEDLTELLPEQEHIVLDDLEDLYQINTGETE